jgi:hypothetical protein
LVYPIGTQGKIDLKNNEKQFFYLNNKNLIKKSKNVCVANWCQKIQS